MASYAYFIGLIFRCAYCAPESTDVIGPMKSMEQCQQVAEKLINKSDYSGSQFTHNSGYINEISGATWYYKITSDASVGVDGEIWSYWSICRFYDEY